MAADVEPAYDEHLQMLLESMLPLTRPLGVKVAGDASRYNAALWFAMKYGLAYDYDGAVFTIQLPA